MNRQTPRRAVLFCLTIALLLILAACQDGADNAAANGEPVASTGATSPAPENHDSSQAEASDDAAGGIPLGQLPRDVRPVHYDLALTIVPAESHFSGSTGIDLEFDQPSDHFYLHGRDLEPSRVEIVLADGTRSEASWELVDDSGVVRIGAGQPLSGTARLEVDYRAPFNESLEALYRVQSGEDWYAFTQFEAISARMAFPGFDEPWFKVPFDISMTVRNEHEAITSTPPLDIVDAGDGMKTIRFATTRPMPTYLVAFAVGPFDVVEHAPVAASEFRDQPIPLRGVAVRGKGAQLKYALENTEGILHAIEEYFQLPYPYAKLDLIAVPDFNAGAMENVGAITYRESLLLFDDNATPQRLRRFHVVHGHELAHQWFGNLVTPVWWDDIWLNEAFATWASYVTLDRWAPDAGYREDLNAQSLGVMGTDSLISARQIRQPVESNHDIAGAFDGITYSKGGGVLSMFESLLGREAFRDGVTAYLEKHAWGTATTDDFIASIAAQSSELAPEKVASAFRSFLEQPGLPLVNVAPSCTDGAASVTLAQSRYLPLGSKGSTEQQWEIPVCLLSGSEGDSSRTCLLLDEPQKTFELPGSSCPDYLMPNADSAGYYRFAMDKEGWNELLSHTGALSNDEMLAVTDSLDGAFNSGDVDVSTYLTVTPEVAKHPKWRIATDPIGQLGFIHERLADEDQKPVLEREYQSFYGPRLDQVGLDTSNDRDHSELQSRLVNFLSLMARSDRLRESLRDIAVQYTGYGSEPLRGLDYQGLNPNVLSTALEVTAQELGRPFIEYLDRLLDTTDDPVQRGHLLAGMSANLDPAVTPELMSLSLSDRLRDNEIYSVALGQVSNEETQEAAWNWMQANLDPFLERMPTWAKGRVVFFGRGSCDEAGRQRVEDYFGPLVADLQGGPRALAQLLEGMDLCIAKVQEHKPELDAWVASRPPSP